VTIGAGLAARWVDSPVSTGTVTVPS